MNENNKNNKAFTLIELIVVMAVIAILVLLAAPSFLGYTKEAKVTAMKQDTKMLSDAAELYYLKEKEWPIDKNKVTVDLFEVGGVDSLYLLDESKINKSIKNTTNDLSEFGIATSGKHKGQVFHLSGIENKRGIVKYSYLNEKSRPVYTKEEMDKKIKSGYKKISKPEDLQEINNGGLDGKYILTNDIDMRDIKNYTPIGTTAGGAMFTGEFDGAGFTISNLKVKGRENYNGLFGSLDGAQIENIHIYNADISGVLRTGILAGNAKRTKIHNTHSSGKVYGGHDTAGLIGTVGFSSKITDSSSTASVKSFEKENAGGLVGWLGYNSSIKDSYATGDVAGIYDIGGLVGENRESNISNSYSTGNVNGKSRVGGFVGQSWANDSTSINNSYSIGDAVGNSLMGSFIGHRSQNIKNSYFNSDTASLDVTAGGIGKTTKELKTSATFKEWDSSIWSIKDGHYPKLRWQLK